MTDLIHDDLFTGGKRCLITYLSLAVFSITDLYRIDSVTAISTNRKFVKEILTSTQEKKDLLCRIIYVMIF